MELGVFTTWSKWQEATGDAEERRVRIWGSLGESVCQQPFDGIAADRRVEGNWSSPGEILEGLLEVCMREQNVATKQKGHACESLQRRHCESY